MHIRQILIATALLLPVPGFAQSPAPIVPAIDTTTSPPAVLPPVPLISTKHVLLTSKEAAGVAIASKYARARQLPVAGDNGAVMFLYGAALPSVVCAPLYVCDIALQPGEVVNDVNIGDAVRWKVSPSVSGTGADKVTHVLIKPTDAALKTDLVISTDRRTYTIQLVSTAKHWMPLVAFKYPDDIKREWAAYEQHQAQHDAADILPNGKDLARLDFGYALGGDNPAWKPLRVYSDGSKTFIQMPATVSSGDLPALVALAPDGGWFSSAKTQIVNYRLDGDTYVVDKVLSHAELISGVGSDQERVTITHDGADDGQGS